MHEMGVVINIIKTANSFAEQNEIMKVKRLTLQIGESSSVMPKYVDMFYYDVIPDYPLLSDSVLNIETVPARAFCLDCGTVFSPGDDCDCDDCRSLRGEELSENGSSEHRSPVCPKCGSSVFKITEGNTIYIKEMEVE